MTGLSIVSGNQCIAALRKNRLHSYPHQRQACQACLSRTDTCYRPFA